MILLKMIVIKITVVVVVVMLFSISFFSYTNELLIPSDFICFISKNDQPLYLFVVLEIIFSAFRKSFHFFLKNIHKAVSTYVGILFSQFLCFLFSGKFFLIIYEFLSVYKRNSMVYRFCFAIILFVFKVMHVRGEKKQKKQLYHVFS